MLNGNIFFQYKPLDENTNDESRKNEENETIKDFWPLVKHISLGSVISVRCAAHTLQLAIEDALKNQVLMDLIGKVRTAVKLLRTPTFK